MGSRQSATRNTEEDRRRAHCKARSTKCGGANQHQGAAELLKSDISIEDTITLGPSRRIAEVLGENFDIDQFACFIPRTVLEAIADNRIRYSDDFDIIVENFDAAVVFCDASGFTALTEALERQPNGAEKLGETINNFFAPLIQVIHFWGGDVIKFSGDALTVVWPVDDDSALDRYSHDPSFVGSSSSPRPPSLSSQSSKVPYSSTPDPLFENEDHISKKKPHATQHSQKRDPNDLRWMKSKPKKGDYKIDPETACRLACQCCLDLHSNLSNFPTPIEGKKFTLHISVAYGKVTILQVGGTLDRWEYVVAGSPMKEISIGEPLAGSGETVISPSVIKVLHGEEGARLSFIDVEGSDHYAQLFELLGPKARPPPPLESIELNDTDVELLKRFIPPAVFKRLTAGYNVFLNELRRISVVFVGVHGLDVSTERGSQAAHCLMQLAQKAAYTMEGSVNKFLVDDKGVIVLLMFGLPPVYHLDDSLRALRVVDGLKSLGLTAGIGVATGRVWCGTVGCDLRKEYTALGNAVNLAARLMGTAQPNEIRCDMETMSLCRHVMDFIALSPVTIKGKFEPVPVFLPTGVLKHQNIMQSPFTDALSSWNNWKYKKRLRRLFCPGYDYRSPIIDVDVPSLDYPLMCGPMFPWEYVEPWLPSLRPTAHLGGVAVIIGNENEGSTALLQYLAELGKSLGRSVFFCSNMPDSEYINIGNVPLLAWRKLCIEMVTQWRWSPARDLKGYSKVNRDNSLFGLAKELIHPVFHWRLHEMKSVIHGLVLPSELEKKPKHKKKPRNRYSADGFLLRRLKDIRKKRKKAASCAECCLMKYASSDDRLWYFLDNKSSDDEDGSSTPSGSGVGGGYDSSYQRTEDQSLAATICSLVNGFSMYHCCVVCLHVRSGTSLFASMDSESWEVARLIGKVAMMRRRRKIELDMRELKKWRQTHSRHCIWCRGTTTPIQTLSGRVIYPQWSPRCKPPPSKYFPPLIFVLACSESSSVNAEQRELIEWAKESNCLLRMKPLTPIETGMFFAHCLQVTRQDIPKELIEYVHRTTAGIPKYISLTAKNLLEQKAILLTNDASETLESDRSSQRRQTDTDPPSDIADDSPDLIVTQQLFTGNSFLHNEVSATSDDGLPDSEDNSDTLRAPKQLTVYRFKKYSDYASNPPFSMSAGRLRRRSSASRSARSHTRSSVSTRTSALSRGQVDDLKIALMYRLDVAKHLDREGQVFVKKSGASLVGAVEDPNDVDRLTSDFPEPTTRTTAAADGDPSRSKKQRHHSLLLDVSGPAGAAAAAAARRNLYVPPGPDDYDREARSYGVQPTRWMAGFSEAHAIRWSNMNPENTTESATSFSHNTVAKKEEKKSDGPLSQTSPNASTECSPPPSPSSRPLRVRVVKDLRRVPFATELKGAAMSLMERLEPDEQLAAKIASVFPVPFTVLEVQAVYPRPTSFERFKAMIDGLVAKGMLETCAEPSHELLENLNLYPARPTSRRTSSAQMTAGLQSSEAPTPQEEPSQFHDLQCNSHQLDPPDSQWWRETESTPTDAVFYRFASIVYQHVVSDLLMSAERNFLVRISRKVVCFRLTHGLNFLMKEVNSKMGSDSLDNGDAVSSIEETFATSKSSVVPPNWDLDAQSAGSYT